MSRKTIIILAATSLTLGAALAGSSNLLLFFNPLGLLLVVGGTTLAAYLSFPKSTLLEAWTELRAMGQRRHRSIDELVELFHGLARTRRFRGVRQMEDEALAMDNDFLAMGVALVADERHPDDVRDHLEQEMDFFLSRREAQRAVLSFMGRLAPAFGLAGTIIGLITMLHTVKDPAAVAEGMSVALLTTFYGLMLANLVVLPLERKMKEYNRAEAVEMALMTEGLVGLAGEENGAAIASRISAFRFARPSSPAKPAAAAAETNTGTMGDRLRGLVPSLRKATDER